MFVKTNIGHSGVYFHSIKLQKRALHSCLYSQYKKIFCLGYVEEYCVLNHDDKNTNTHTHTHTAVWVPFLQTHIIVTIIPETPAFGVIFINTIFDIYALRG